MPFEEHNSNGVSLPSCDLAFYCDPYNILHLMLPAWARNLCYEERDAETVRDFFYRTLYMGSFPTFVTIHLFLWALWQIVWLNCFTSIVTNSHLVRFCFYCFIFFVFLSKCVFSLSEKGRAFYCSSLELTSEETVLWRDVLSTLHTLKSFMPEELISKMFWSQKPGHWMP